MLRNTALVVLWPFATLGRAVAWTASWSWHIVIAGTPPLMAIWMMRHERQHRERQEH